MGKLQFRGLDFPWIQSTKVHFLRHFILTNPHPPVSGRTQPFYNHHLSRQRASYVHELNMSKCCSLPQPKIKKKLLFFFALFCISEGLFLYNYNVQASCYVCIIMYISFIESKAAAIFFRTFWEESPMNFTCIKRFPATNHSSWHDSFLGHLCSTTIINQREHQPYQHQMPASEHRILSQCPISLAVALSMNGKLVRFNSFKWCPTTRFEII